MTGTCSACRAALTHLIDACPLGALLVRSTRVTEIACVRLTDQPLWPHAAAQAELALCTARARLIQLALPAFRGLDAASRGARERKEAATLSLAFIPKIRTRAADSVEAPALATLAFARALAAELASATGAIFRTCTVATCEPVTAVLCNVVTDIAECMERLALTSIAIEPLRAVPLVATHLTLARKHAAGAIYADEADSTVTFALFFVDLTGFAFARQTAALTTRVQPFAAGLKATIGRVATACAVGHLADALAFGDVQVFRGIRALRKVALAHEVEQGPIALEAVAARALNGLQAGGEVCGIDLHIVFGLAGDAISRETESLADLSCTCLLRRKGIREVARLGTRKQSCAETLAELEQSARAIASDLARVLARLLSTAQACADEQHET